MIKEMKKQTKGGNQSRSLLLVLTVLVLLLGLAACSGADSASQKEESTSAAGQESPAETEAETWETIVPETMPVFVGSETADSTLYVEPIEGLTDDFIRGVDISSFVSERESGVVYRDFDGKELSDEEFFSFLAQCGVNWVRIRVWNDPVDKNGNSYGGGHNDLDTAITIGRLASQAGMKVLIDFHYSDFWADPSKQKAPKEWAHYSLTDKETAIAAYTSESLERMFAADVNVAMVQVGNETNNGMAGETDESRIYTLMRSACAAIREVSQNHGQDIRIAVHYTNPEASGFPDYCGKLIDAGVDFDIFAASYYPFWHGTTKRLTENLTTIANTYGKQVMVAETSYLYTSEDGDGFANSVSADTAGIALDYDISVQGQANEVRAVMEAVKNVGDAGLGVFYWEPAWIPVGPASDVSGNAVIWETYGSGWASSYAVSYDPNDAGKYYGGSSWDNQAMFDFEGNPLDSLNVFRYLYSGTTAPLAICRVDDMEWESPIGEPVQMPETVDAFLNSGATKALTVEWDAAAVAAAEEQGAGDYPITGTAFSEDGHTSYPVTCTLHIMEINYVKNPGFEDTDMTMWSLTGAGVDRTQDNNKHTGDYSLKFYSEQKVEWTAEQTIENLPAGTYELSACVQGGDAGADAVFQLYITVNGEEYTADTGVTSWQQWANPTVTGIEIPEGASVTIGVRVNAAPKAWGAWDDFTLYKR